MPKILFFSVLFSILSSVLYSQEINFEINGKFKNAGSLAKIYLFYPSNQGYTVDSSRVVDGKFSFAGKIDRAVKANLLLDHLGVGLGKLQQSPDVTEIYLESHKVNIEINDSLSKSVVLGGNLNEVNTLLNKEINPEKLKIKRLIAEAAVPDSVVKKNPGFKNELFKKYLILLSQIKIKIKHFIKANASSQVSLDAFFQYFNVKEDPIDAEKTFGLFSPAIKESNQGKQWLNKFQQIKTTEIGAIAPDFTLPDTGGHLVKLSSLRGKYVLIDFWASWCGPCRMENPNVLAVYTKYHLKNFTILGVSLDKAGEKQKWLNAIKNDRLTWTQVSDLGFWNNQAAILYGIRSIPSNFLLNPEGKIIGLNLRGRELDDKLREVLE